MAPKVSIIVPLAGGPAQALRCLQGIAAQAEDPAHEIIVVDDASVGLEPLLSQLAGDVEVLRNERRLGFAALGPTRRRARPRRDHRVHPRRAQRPRPDGSRRSPPRLEDPAVGLAASATDGPTASQSPVAAWSVAVRAADLRATELPDLPGQLVFGALALALAERWPARGDRARLAASLPPAPAPAAPAVRPARSPS